MAADTLTTTTTTAPTDTYSPDTRISMFTCRPLTDDQTSVRLHRQSVKKNSPVFWCEEHKVQLKNVYSVISHFKKKHRRKESVTTTTTTATKRKHPDVETIKEENGQDGVVAKRKRGGGGEAAPAPVIPAEHLRCELCDVDYGVSQRADLATKLALSHFKSKKHIAKLEHAYQMRMASQMKCIACDVEHNSVSSALIHYKSRKHIAKASEAFGMARQPPPPPQLAPQIAPLNGFQQPAPFVAPPHMNGASGGGGGGGGGVPSSCELCGCTLTSAVNAQNHFNGKKHLNKVRMLSVGNGL